LEIIKKFLGSFENRAPGL